MKSDSGRTVSSWMGTAEVPPAPALAEDLEVDVCVVGAGISGLTTAYLLAREGKSVVVLDDGPIAGGESCRTTAHLASEIDDYYYEIERIHGAEGAHLAYLSHSSAIDRIQSIIETENIDCDFQRLDAYMFVEGGESAQELDKELEAALRAGFIGVEKLQQAPLNDFATGACLRFPQQGQFHPLKYFAGLAECIVRQGGRIFTGTHVTEIKGSVDEKARVETRAGAVVRADAVVVATNSPVNDRVAIHTKQSAYRTYAVGARVPRGAVPRALYWDTLDPYHYVRLQDLDDAHELLIIGGEDHKTGQENDADERYARLESWGRQHFPAMQSVEFRWSGQVFEPIDGLAYIGPNPGDAPNIFIATGDSGMGMTHGTIAGILLTDLIMGRENPWAKLYDPARKPIKAASDFLHENLNVALQYADLVVGGDVKSAEEIPAGQGAVLQRGLGKIAVFRDENGALHECSALCPHLGCVVQWNSGETSWDCPCHGSRFDAYGRVITGPANRDLGAVE